MIQPARRRTLHEEISTQIVELITSGQWPEGEKIPGEVSLSEQFQVSRNSVRESMKALEIVGLLVSMPGKGTFVAENAADRVRLIQFYDTLDDTDPEQAILDLMEARFIVEPGLCWQAATKGDATRIDEMERIVDQSLDAVDHNEYHFELGMAFHETLYIASGNPVLIELFNGIREKLGIVRREIYFKVNKKEILVRELEEHRTIVELIRQGEADKAAAAMREHLGKPIARLKKILLSDTDEHDG
jgi:GntR family transcriptional repressor for pyruvate dehydrogenase complex